MVVIDVGPKLEPYVSDRIARRGGDAIVIPGILIHDGALAFPTQAGNERDIIWISTRFVVQIFDQRGAICSSMAFDLVGDCDIKRPGAGEIEFRMPTESSDVRGHDSGVVGIIAGPLAHRIAPSGDGGLAFGEVNGIESVGPPVGSYCEGVITGGTAIAFIHLPPTPFPGAARSVVATLVPALRRVGIGIASLGRNWTVDPRVRIPG